MSSSRFNKYLRYVNVASATMLTAVLVGTSCEPSRKYAEQPTSHALTFTRQWISGTLAVDQAEQRELRATSLAVRIRVDDAAAAAADLGVGLLPNDGSVCRDIRVLYRATPGSPAHIMQATMSGSRPPMSDEPMVCFYAGTEWGWNVVILSSANGSGRADYLRQMVLYPGEARTREEQVRVVVAAQPRNAEDTYSAAVVQKRAVALSQWVALASR